MRVVSPDIYCRISNCLRAALERNQDREINLCPRALQALHAQLSLRARMAAAGMIHHNYVFFTAVCEQFVDTFLPYRRWSEVLATLPFRYRKPYNSRESVLAGTAWRE